MLRTLNRQIGRRTGQNVLEGKVIRKQVDGRDRFSDYFTSEDENSSSGADEDRDYSCTKGVAKQDNNDHPLEKVLVSNSNIFANITNSNILTLEPSNSKIDGTPSYSSIEDICAKNRAPNELLEITHERPGYAEALLVDKFNKCSISKEVIDNFNEEVMNLSSKRNENTKYPTLSNEQLESVSEMNQKAAQTDNESEVDQFLDTNTSTKKMNADQLHNIDAKLRSNGQCKDGTKDLKQKFHNPRRKFIKTLPGSSKTFPKPSTPMKIPLTKHGYGRSKYNKVLKKVEKHAVMIVKGTCTTDLPPPETLKSHLELYEVAEGNTSHFEETRNNCTTPVSVNAESSMRIVHTWKSVETEITAKIDAKMSDCKMVPKTKRASRKRLSVMKVLASHPETKSIEQDCDHGSTLPSEEIDDNHQSSISNLLDTGITSQPVIDLVQQIATEEHLSSQDLHNASCSLITSSLDKIQKNPSSLLKTPKSKGLNISFKTRSGKRKSMKKFYPPLNKEYNRSQREYSTLDCLESESPFVMNLGTAKSTSRNLRRSNAKPNRNIMPEIGVLDGKTNSELQSTVVTSFRSVPWSCPASQSSGKFEIKIMFELPDFAMGFIRLIGFQRKERQYLPDWDLLFVIVEGEIEVSVHETTTLLRQNDTFLVPRGNFYSIENVQQSAATLTFFRNSETLLLADLT